MKTRDKIDNAFALGIDLGRSRAKVCYYDYRLEKEHIYDMTGGYGDTSIPTELQYIVEEDKWLIGIDARNNREQDDTVYIDNFLDLLENNEEIIINNQAYSSFGLMMIFIEKIMEGLKLINPLVTVKSLTVSLVDELYFMIEEDMKAKAERLNHMSMNIIPSTKATIYYLISNNKLKEGTSYIYDFGYSAFRKYRIIKNRQDISINLEERDEQIGGEIVENIIKGLIKEKFLEPPYSDIEDEKVNIRLEQVGYQYYPRIFKEYCNKKDVKVYYNFIHPPFYKVISFEAIDSALSTLINRFEEKAVSPSSSPVYLIGSGYKMIWPKEHMHKNFHDNLRGAHDIEAFGCCLAARNNDAYKLYNISLDTCDSRVYGMMISDDKGEMTFDSIGNINKLSKEGSLEGYYIIDTEEDKACILSILSKDKGEGYKSECKVNLDITKSYRGLMRIKVIIEQVADDTIDGRVIYLPV